MSLQVEKLEHNMAKLTVEVPAEELEKAIEKVYQKSKKSISVPGFRKGKAPRKMIERMYGTGVFLEDAVNDLLPDAYAKAAEESELEITSRPAVDITQVEPGGEGGRGSDGRGDRGRTPQRTGQELPYGHSGRPAGGVTGYSDPGF